MAKKQIDRYKQLTILGVPRYIRCYDNGGRTIDRYTVVFIGNYNQRGRDQNGYGWQPSYQYVTMNADPFHPQVFYQHGPGDNGSIDRDKYGYPPAIGRSNHLGKRITYYDLPDDCKRIVLKDYLKIWDLNPDFEGYVKSLNGGEVIMTMVLGLEHNFVTLDTGTFGQYDPIKNICYGCAATNAICHLIGQPIKRDFISIPSDRAKYVNVDFKFLNQFEQAINELRMGYIDGYNAIASAIGISLIAESPELCLATMVNFHLWDGYQKAAALAGYRKLAIANGWRNK